MIIFSYNKRIDKKCWQRIIETNTMFGHKFPSSFGDTPKRIAMAKKAVKIYQNIWNSYGQQNFRKNIKKIYKHNFPKDINCYINTTPYSMDGDGYISVSVKHIDNPEKIISSIIHEASHYMFRKYFKCNDLENIKEYVTAINNVEFKGIKDIGWKIHQKEREKALKIWIKTKDLQKVIDSFKNDSKSFF